MTSQPAEQHNDEEWKPWWVRVWHWLREWWSQLHLDIVLLAIVLIGGTLTALQYHNAPWPWQEPPPAGTDPLTFGDVTELLIVPLTLAVVAYVFSTYQRRQDREIAADQRKQDREIAERERDNDREIARDRNEEAELQTYFDRMAELMLKHDLRPSSSSNEGEDEEQPDQTEATVPHNSTAASIIARARTLAVLRSVKSPDRKGSIVRFLYESGLIHREGTVVVLRGADLRGANLDRATLRGANLEGAYLRLANLLRTDLREANLSGATLEGADLRWSDLSGATLEGADLSGPDLVGIGLPATGLTGANLSETTTDKNTNFNGARYNKETTPPPGGFPDSAINVDAWDARKAPNNDDTHAKEQ
jgi:uncharacterized protein YjbI with pentapeptide repeats